jgi:hypothetical protein
VIHLACLVTVIFLGSCVAIVAKGTQAVIVLPGVIFTLIALPIAADDGLGTFFFSVGVFMYTACVGLLFSVRRVGSFLAANDEEPIFNRTWYAGSDYNSPAARGRRYRLELLKRCSERVQYLTVFALLDMTIGWFVLKAELNGCGPYTSLLIVPAMLLGGDAFQLLGRWSAYQLFCPRYDKASQPRPTFEVPYNLRSLWFLV